MKVVIITGMSGAGRSRAADWFEDHGYYCIDNIPPALIKQFLEMAAANTKTIDKAAFVTDARSTNFFEKMVTIIDELKATEDYDVTILYLEASANEIVKRYNEVRRSHPLTGGEASKEVIEQEISMLKPVRERADFIIDTTSFKVPELYAELDRIILEGAGASKFSVNLSSFGFKYGVPTEADIMFDVRFIPNPYWVPSLRKLTGQNKKVVDYIFKHGISGQFVDSIHVLLKSLIPGYINEGKYHINIAFGCTGGHHRSVAIAEALAAKFQDDGMRVRVTHRDLDIMSKTSRSEKKKNVVRK